MAFPGKRMRREREERRVFYCSPLGRKEIERMVVECSLFSTIEPGDDAALARRNYLLELLLELGVLNDENIPNIVDSLLRLDYKEEEVE